MYAQLCKRLSEEAPNFEPADRPCTFKITLLNKCKNEFDQRSKILEQFAHAAHQTIENEERRHLAKRKMLGNIKFIGELGKLDILSEGILHKCVQQLLCVRRSDESAEDLECLCQILRTCGRIMDTDKGKGLMDQYFVRMSCLADSAELQPRIRFMLKDVIDLRKEGWAPRKVTLVEGPVPIHQIRPADGGDRSGGGGGGGGNFRRERNNIQDRDDRPQQPDLFRHPMKTRGGIEEMMLLSLSSSATTNFIPTHPYGSNGFGGGGGGQRDGGFRAHNNQRGFNNYNNQRGQYKHNQNNGNTQYNNQSNKEIAPRFKKNLIMPREQNLGELELRPSANSMLFNKPSVKSQNIMNIKPMEPPQQTHAATAPPPPKPAPTLKEPLPIKPTSADKPKQAKKDKGPTKEEVVKKFVALISDYASGEATLQQSTESYQEHKTPDKFVKDAITAGLKLFAIEKNTEEIGKLVELLYELKRETLVTHSAVLDSFKMIGQLVDECENEKNKIIASLATVYACAYNEKLLSLQELASFTEHGVNFPLFMDTLQQIKEVVGEKTLGSAFNDAKIEILSQLTESDRSKERLAEILEEKKLTFLCPMLLLEADLAKQLQIDPNPQQFYKWIRENLESIDFHESGFIIALMTVLLKYITQEALDETGAGDDKAIAEKEKQLLDHYQPILHAFLNEKPALQLVAIYALQVHFHSIGFPRGHLLRWFNALYDLSIVEEEAFLTWKEDVTDVYPGKGQALFQVSQWLHWLQETESEEEEGDE